MKYKLSIIIPIYNSEKYLESCILSILNQTLSNYEIILINDGSIDNSQKICEKYSKQYDYIRLINTKNNGAASARNLGMSISDGEYMAFVDSDDIIEDNMYEKMYELGKKYEADIVICGYKETNINKEIIKINKLNYNDKSYIEGEDIKKEFERYISNNGFMGYPSMCNKIYKSEYINKNNLRVNESITVAEDMCFNISAILNSKKIGFINEELYNYRRINKESIMNSQKKYSLSDLKLNLNARQEILNLLSNYNIDDEIYNNYVKYENHITLSDFIGIIIIKLKSHDKIKQKLKDIHTLLKNEEFNKALYNTNMKYFHIKAKFIIGLIKIFNKYHLISEYK